MIENIQSNGSYAGKEGKKNVRLPKNIRQVGQAGNNKKIYIEDYVMTYIKQLAMKNYGTYQCAVLLGETKECEDCINIFISGAVEVDNSHYDLQKVYNNETWSKVYDDIKTYFKDAEIVGWYITRPGLLLEINEEMTKIHVNNFAGTNKVLLMYDSVEREDAFYIYGNTKLHKQSGYFIYYERNEVMQNYMVEHKQKASIEFGYTDSTSRDIRKLLDKKKAQQEKKKGTIPIFYIATTVVAVFILIIAAQLLSGQPLKEPDTKPVMNQSADNATNGPGDTITPQQDTKINVIPGELSANQEVIGESQENKEEKSTRTPGNLQENNSEDKQYQSEGVGEATVKPASDGSESTNQNEDDIKVTIEDTKPITEETSDTGQESDPGGETTPVQADSGESYIVQHGDTLASICRKLYNNSQYISKIKELNQLEDENKIFEGQRLKLP